MLETRRARTRRPRGGIDATSGQEHPSSARSGWPVGTRSPAAVGRLEPSARYTKADVDPLKAGSVEVNTAVSE